MTLAVKGPGTSENLYGDDVDAIVGHCQVPVAVERTSMGLQMRSVKWLRSSCLSYNLGPVISVVSSPPRS